MKNRFKNLYLILPSLIVFGCTTPESTPQNLTDGETTFTLAENMKKSGDYGSAIGLYRQTLMINPEHKVAQYALAEALMLNQNFEESCQILDKMLEEDPSNEFLMKMRGKLSIFQNDPKKCLETYSILNKKYPQDGNVMNGLGICHDLIKDHHQAQIAYKKALVLSPNNFDIQSNYGLSLALAGKFSDSIEILSKLARQSKATLQIKHNLAVAYGLAGQKDQAKQLFSEDLESVSVSNNMEILHSLQKSLPNSKPELNVDHMKLSENIIMPEVKEKIIAEKLISTRDENKGVLNVKIKKELSKSEKMKKSTKAKTKDFSSKNENKTKSKTHKKKVKN